MKTLFSSLLFLLCTFVKGQQLNYITFDSHGIHDFSIEISGASLTISNNYKKVSYTSSLSDIQYENQRIKFAKNSAGQELYFFYRNNVLHKIEVKGGTSIEFRYDSNSGMLREITCGSEEVSIRYNGDNTISTFSCGNNVYLRFEFVSGELKMVSQYAQSLYLIYKNGQLTSTEGKLDDVNFSIL